LNLYKALVYLGIAAPLFAQYAGPAVLSRGEAPAAMATPQIDFRPYLTVTGTYDTGLTGVSVTSSGQLSSNAAYGIQLGGGISGVHSWKHTRIGLNYNGTLNHYLGKGFFDNTAQSLSLGITHEFTRHVTLNLRESAGVFSQDFAQLGLPQTVPFDSSQSYIPVTDFFNNRTIYLTSQADLIFQKSARLSFDIGADGFLNRERSSALYGVTGASARGDMQYRVTRRTTIGAQYTYTHYSYTGIFSSADIHGAVGTFATRLTQWWEFSGYAGVMRVESKFVQSIPLDPVVAALLGVSTGYNVVYSATYIPDVSARLSRTFHRGVFYLTGGRAIMPGNGLFLTTEMTTGATGYTYTGLRKWSFTGQGLYERGTSLGNILGVYGDYSGGLAMSREIVKSLHFIAGAEARHYNSPSFTQYNRTIYDAHIGLGFAPGSVPLRLW